MIFAWSMAYLYLINASFYSFIALSLALTWLAWLALKKLFDPLLIAAKHITAMATGVRPVEPFPIQTQDEVGQLLAGINFLINQGKNAEDHASRLTQVNQALSHINQAIVRLDSESELFQAVCRIAVDYGGMKMVWVGEHDPNTLRIVPIASEGIGCEYLDNIIISSREDIPEGQGPTGTAFRENRTYLCQDFNNDPVVSPWQARGRKFGWGSSAVFPINRGGNPRYVVTLYSDKAYAFDTQVVQLLYEIVGDIAYALDNFDREEQKHRAINALRENTLRLNQAVDLAHLATWEYDIESGLFSFDDRYYALHGTSTEREGGNQMSALRFAQELLPPEETPIVAEEIKKALASPDANYKRHFHTQILRRDGNIRQILLDIGIIKDTAGNTVKLFGASQDITDRKLEEEKYTRIIQASLDAFFYGNGKGEFLDVNAAACKMTGYDREQLLSMRIQDLEAMLSQEDIAYNMEKMSKIGYDRFESQWWDCQGNILEIDVSVNFIGENDDLRFFAFVRDITERKMHESKLLLLGEITESAADGVNLVKAADGLIQYANRRFHEMFGYAQGELEGKHVSILNAPMDKSPVDIAAAIMRSLETDGIWIGELANQKSDGSVFWTNASVSTFNHPEHGILWISHQTDITARKLAEEQLRLSAKVFDSSTEAIIVTDAAVNIISVNPAFTEITGYGFDEVAGKNPRLLSSGLHDSQFFADFWQTLEENGCWQGEIWNRRKNGEIYPEWLSITMVRNSMSEASNFVGFFSDISDRKAAQQKIDFLSFHDSLTGLPNRQFAIDRINQCIAHAQHTHSKFAILVIDMDNFKSINDSLGHPAGDFILAAVATRLRESMRELDMVSRLGADEFLAVLLDVNTSDEIIRISEKLLEIMALPFSFQQQEISMSVSIGVAVFPSDGGDFETLLKNGDLAMYRAKEAGRNTYLFFDESINTNAFEYLYLRNGLRRALERSDFVLHYQPQIDLYTGELIGAEALLRWLDPELGLILPDRFIAVAEESGLIIPIGEWVLFEACRQAMEWQQAGLPKCLIGVNLSAVQFKRGDLAKTVKMALDKTGLNPACLELELTESILIRETENILSRVSDLKMLGVKLSIDDFGTGYSSLSYLKRFNVDKIKIDKSFVMDLKCDAGDLAIVQAIIQIAKSLSMKTIAEGVENQEIVELLRSLHCDEAQGYFYARPMPKDEFADYLSHYQPYETAIYH
jgi:diguanylate cyclase (GGDEF)-like protein/PAS domain S-box-containing protein